MVMWCSQRTTRRRKFPSQAEGPFDFPAPLVAPQLAAILQRGLDPVLSVRANQLNASLGQPLSQGIRVASFVVDHPLRVLARSPGAMAGDGNDVQGRLQQPYFGRGR